MRRPLSVILVLLVLVGAGACADEKKSPQQIVAGAPAETVASRTSKVALNVNVAGGAEAVAFKGDGVFDFKAQRGRLVLDLSGLGLPGATRNTEIVFNADVVFMKLPFEVPQLKARPWVKIDLSELDELSGIDVARLRQIQSNDPTAALNYLRGVTDAVKVVGREDVRGTMTTHYKAVIDLRKAAREVPPQLKDDIVKIARQLGSATIDSDVWIDTEGRLRKLQYGVDLSKVEVPTKEGEAPPTGTLTATFELFEFGTDAAVADPPADQVTNLKDLIRRPPAPKR
ncbi:MAG: hypothetical protein M3P85_00915 [Actinomycetota bacterium]|nr:hypothetical protein [Actinomycetota bacterium]PLS74780.1 MAG: hypothetical protein CYG61_10710 [Actinomycetota bacterium]